MDGRLYAKEVLRGPCGRPKRVYNGDTIVNQGMW